MRNRLAIAAAVCAAGSSAAWAAADVVQVSVAPSVAPDARVQVATVASDPAAFDGPLPSLTWSVGGGTSAMLGAAWKDGQLLPSIGLLRRLVTQDDAGVDVGVSVAFRSVGREDTGSELATAVVLGRTFGDFSISAN